jgi:hypothetical protein
MKENEKDVSVAHMGKKRKQRWVSMGKPEAKRPLGIPTNR